MAVSSSSSSAHANALPESGAVSLDGVENIRGARGVTPRVVLLCLGLAFFFGYIIPVIDVRMANTFLGAAHLPPGAIGALLVLLLIVNPLLRLVSKRLAFSRNEVLTVYITTLFSALVPGHGSENFFIGQILGPFYFATRENKWLEFLQPYVKPWMTPALNADGSYNRTLVETWYTGSETIPWAAWIIPLVAWGTLIFVSYFMLGCLSVILRAQWSDREALAFPLLKLPLQMTEDVDHAEQFGVLGRFFRNPLMWIGFGIGVFVQLMNGLHYYYPDVPSVPLEITGNFFTEAPLNQVGWLPFKVWPIVVGVTFLLTSEISFSLWFFFLFLKFQLVAAYVMGFNPSTLPNLVGHVAGAKNFNGYQQIGAYLAYVAIVLWTGREHFKYVARRGLGLEKRTDAERLEPLSYPVAFWGFILSFAFMVAWSTAAGMRPDVALYLWGMYLVIAIALTRVIAEGGVLFVQQGWVPLGAITQIVGGGPGTWMAPSSVVPGSFIQAAMMTDMRGFIMPSFVQGFKLARDRNISTRPLMALIMAVIAISLCMGIYMNTKAGYQHGGLTLEGWFAQGGAKGPANNSSSLVAGVPDVNKGNVG
ncbi:MAG TPA: DUF6785 family protein, partial [Abditibacteriaceae bacterium]